MLVGCGTGGRVWDFCVRVDKGEAALTNKKILMPCFAVESFGSAFPALLYFLLQKMDSIRRHSASHTSGSVTSRGVLSAQS